MLPALGPEPTQRGSIHGGIAGHFLPGVASSVVTSTSVGVAAALALVCAATLLLLSVPCLVCSCYCSCSRCCSRSCSCLRCCSNLATLHSDAAGVKEEPAVAGRGACRRGTPIYIRVQGGSGGRRRWWGGGVGITRVKARHGGPRGMAGAAADRRWGVFSGRCTAGRGRRGAAVWPVVAGGSVRWRLKMNRRPLISYPTAAKSTNQR